MIASIWHRDYGIVAKCPHCGRENVPRVNYNQVTCGSTRCRYLQGESKRRSSRARQKRLHQ